MAGDEWGKAKEGPDIEDDPLEVESISSSSEEESEAASSVNLFCFRRGLRVDAPLVRGSGAFLFDFESRARKKYGTAVEAEEAPVLTAQRGKGEEAVDRFTKKVLEIDKRLMRHGVLMDVEDLRRRRTGQKGDGYDDDFIDDSNLFVAAGLDDDDLDELVADDSGNDDDSGMIVVVYRDSNAFTFDCIPANDDIALDDGGDEDDDEDDDEDEDEEEGSTQPREEGDITSSASIETSRHRRRTRGPRYRGDIEPEAWRSEDRRFPSAVQTAFTKLENSLTTIVQNAKMQRPTLAEVAAVCHRQLGEAFEQLFPRAVQKEREEEESSEVTDVIHALNLELADAVRDAVAAMLPGAPKLAANVKMWWVGQVVVANQRTYNRLESALFTAILSKCGLLNRRKAGQFITRLHEALSTWALRVSSKKDDATNGSSKLAPAVTPPPPPAPQQQAMESSPFEVAGFEILDWAVAFNNRKHDLKEVGEVMEEWRSFYSYAADRLESALADRLRLLRRDARRREKRNLPPAVVLPAVQAIRIPKKFIEDTVRYLKVRFNVALLYDRRTGRRGVPPVFGSGIYRTSSPPGGATSRPPSSAGRTSRKTTTPGVEEKLSPKSKARIRGDPTTTTSSIALPADLRTKSGKSAAAARHFSSPPTTGRKRKAVDGKGEDDRSLQDNSPRKKRRKREEEETPRRSQVALAAGRQSATNSSFSISPSPAAGDASQ